MAPERAPARAGRVALSLELLEEGARRLAGLAAVLVVTVIALYLFQRLMQPQIAPLFDDPVTRLVGAGGDADGGGTGGAASLQRRDIAHAARVWHAVRDRRGVLDCDGGDVAAVRLVGSAAGPFGRRAMDRRSSPR